MDGHWIVRDDLGRVTANVHVTDDHQVELDGVVMSLETVGRLRRSLASAALSANLADENRAWPIVMDDDYGSIVIHSDGSYTVEITD